ncbi:MAG: hypothetical protein M0023_08595 [Desulfobacteraceae bacterium]|nr:hypothetical protein [Desulfobacteraceae bacterium]
MPNPFYLKELPVDGPFCNRVKELTELADMARSKNNAVIHSPRRFGKTSLVRRVQNNLAAEGAITIFADFFGVGSVEEVAARMAESVFRVTRQNEPIWKKAIRAITSFRPIVRPNRDSGIELTVEPAGGTVGLPLLKNTMEELGQFIKDYDGLVHIALDEFQEIVSLHDSLKIEATMRTEIQRQQASYFFIGSQRRILGAIFSESHRPFFRSAFDYKLPPLPENELAEFLQQQFKENGVTCDFTWCLFMVKQVGAFPYYAQKMAYFIYEYAKAEGVINGGEITAGTNDMLSNEKAAFEASLQGIPSQQRMFLRALAMEPTKQPFARAYTRKHNLGSLSALQNAVKQLQQLDLIEQDDEEYWKIVDPVFRLWLASGKKAQV